MPEKNLDLNEENTSTGDGRPEDKNNSSAPSEEELDKEIDKILEEGDDDDDDDEETVIISKKELARTERDRDNYKEGLISLKKKGKGKEKVEKKEAKTDEPLTKKEFQKANENQAIKIACKDSEVEDNWDEIVKFYTPRHGKSDVDGIVEDINDALILFQKKNENKEEDKEDKEDKKSTADLASDKNLSGGDSSKKKSSNPERKSVIPKKETAQDWYPEEDQ